MPELTILYYTSNHLDTKNPLFLRNTKKQLAKAIGNLPLIVVSHKPVDQFTEGEYKNVVVDLPRHHLSIYKQILIGAKEAKTDYVALAEDDILYSFEHFHSPEIEKNLKPDLFVYDMCKVSLFTWTQPPMFSFRTKRKVINQLVAPRKYLIEALEERFRRVEELKSMGWTEEKILHYFGDLGRYEKQLGVTIRNTYEAYCNNPSIVFSHPEAYGYLSQGSKKKLGDLKIIELYGWGRASEVLKLWGDYPLK